MDIGDTFPGLRIDALNRNSRTHYNPSKIGGHNR